jgi:hypothetical protein
MKAAHLALVLMVALVSGASAGALVIQGYGRPAPVPVLPVDAAAPVNDLGRRLAAAEARIEELAAGMDRLAKAGAEREAAALRREAAEAEAAAAKPAADPAASLLSAATGEAKPAPEAKGADLDAFAKEVSKGIRKNLQEEFRRFAALVTDPTPEALEARRQQLRLFANVMAANAGLDRAQGETLERVLNDTDEKARDEMRPLLQGVDDYRKVDYGKVKKVTEDTFAGQDARFDQEFPKEKAETLKRQLEPIRTVFGAMIDELGKAAKAEEPPAVPR